MRGSGVRVPVVAQKRHLERLFTEPLFLSYSLLNFAYKWLIFLVVCRRTIKYMSNYNCRRYKKTEGGAISHLCTSNCTKMYTQNYIWCTRSAVISWIPVACNANNSRKMNQKYVAAIFDRKGVASRKGCGKVKIRIYLDRNVRNVVGETTRVGWN